MYVNWEGIVTHFLRIHLYKHTTFSNESTYENAYARKNSFVFAVVCHLLLFFVCLVLLLCRKEEVYTTRQKKIYNLKHNFCGPNTRTRTHQPKEYIRDYQKYKVELSTRKRIGNVQICISHAEYVCDVLKC